MCTEAELADLRWHRSTAYAISYSHGEWLAARRDSGEALTAPDAETLRCRIREDYRARPVPRGC
jgi:hypothetical protein